MIAIDLSKQQALDVDPKAIQQINFTANLDTVGKQDSISFLKKQKKLFLKFSKELYKFWECNFIERNIIKKFNFYQYENDAIQQFKCKAIKFTA